MTIYSGGYSSYTPVKFSDFHWHFTRIVARNVNGNMKNTANKKFSCTSARAICHVKNECSTFFCFIQLKSHAMLKMNVARIKSDGRLCFIRHILF